MCHISSPLRLPCGGSYTSLARLSILYLLLFSFFRAFAARSVDISPFNSFTAPQLIDRANHFLGANQPDSALVYFVMAARKAAPKGSSADTHAKAMLGQWRIYFFYYYDYAKAYSSLSDADGTAGCSHKVKAAVLAAFGNMYQTFYSYSSDPQLGHKATDYYSRSIRSQAKDRGNDLETMTSTLVNLTDMCFWLHDVRKALPYLNMVTKYAADKEPSVRFCILLYKSLLALETGRPNAAVAALLLQEDCLPHLTNSRFALVHYQNLALAYEQKGDRQRAIACYEKLRQCAEAHGGRDAVLLAYEGLMRLYEKSGNDEQARIFRDRYYCLRDSIMNVRAMMNINNVHFLTELKRTEDSLSLMEERHDRLVVILTAALVLAFAIFIFGAVLWRNNRLLRERNRSLFNSYQQTLRSADKPQNSHSIDSNDKELMEKIKDAMLADAGIFESGYTIDRLAVRVGTKPRIVSETINRVYGDNFYALLNSYRIREACRRINTDGDASRLTIEGIAHSVGFKSRTSFLNYFKRNTGITPSEYIRIQAKEQGKKK